MGALDISTLEEAQKLTGLLAKTIGGQDGHYAVPMRTADCFCVAIMTQKNTSKLTFQHYKGGIYKFVCEAKLESDLTPMIVYQAADGTVWIRPKDVFFQDVEIDGKAVPRFAPILATS